MNKVKITYDVDLETIPAKSQELATEAYYWLSGALVKLEQIKFETGGQGFQETLETIDKIRRALSDVDRRLDDCSAIMAGYHKTRIDMLTPQPPPQQDELHQTTEEISEQVRTLQSQLQESVSRNENNE